MAYSYTTEALYSGEHVRGMDMTPETIPCFMTTAFTMRGFKEVQEAYATKGYMSAPAIPTAPRWARSSPALRAASPR